MNPCGVENEKLRSAMVVAWPCGHVRYLFIYFWLLFFIRQALKALHHTF